MELPLRDVRGRARGCPGATAHPVVARDPRRRRAVVPRQRLAGPASAARDARPAARRRRPRAADRGRAADRRGDRPHGRPAPAARVGDAGARLRRRGRRARAARRVSRAARCSSATAAPSGRRSNRGGRGRSTGRASRSSRSRPGGDAPRYLDGPDVGARGERVRLPRPRDRRRPHLRPRARQLGRAAWSRGSPRAISCSSTGRSGATTSSRGWASRTAARATWDTCRSRAPAGRSSCSPGWSDRARCSSTSTTRTRSCSRTRPNGEEVVRAGVEVAYDGLEVEL